MDKENQDTNLPDSSSVPIAAGIPIRTGTDASIEREDIHAIEQTVVVESMYQKVSDHPAANATDEINEVEQKSSSRGTAPSVPASSSSNNQKR